MADIVEKTEEDVKAFALEIEAFFEKLLGFTNPADEEAQEAVAQLKVDTHEAAGTTPPVADAKAPTPAPAPVKTAGETGTT